MRISTRSVALVGALLVLSACQADPQVQTTPAQSALTGTPSSSPSEQATPSDRVADGRYSRVATIADAAPAGVSEEVAGAMLGPDGKMPLALDLDRDRFAFSVTNDAAVSEVGDLGTLSYDEAGRLVLTSESVDVVQVIDWTLSGDVLTLTLMEGPPEDRFVVDGTYTREGSG